MAKRKNAPEKPVKTSIADKLEKLGACEEKVKFYAKFGDDWEAALRRASRDDLRWIVGEVGVSLKPGATLRFSKECRSFGCAPNNKREARDHAEYAVNTRASLSTRGMARLITAEAKRRGY